MIVYAPGQRSTEHVLTVWAFSVGVTLLLAGLTLAVLGAVTRGAPMDSMVQAATGCVLCAVGAYVLTKTVASYARARGEVKAAAVRRPQDSAPRAL